MNAPAPSFAVQTISRMRKLSRGFDRALCDLVLAWAPDAALRGYNDWAYGRQDTFRGDRKQDRWELFAWEQAAVERFCAGPPGRVLVGGAGGGREACALLEMGYQVVAFDPSPTLLDSLPSSGKAGGNIECYLAAYEDLPLLTSLEDERQSRNLREMEPFDAAILGGASFSHVLGAEERRRTLELISEATRGPLLVSWILHSNLSTARRRFRRLLPGRRQRDDAAKFDWHLGAYRSLSAGEMQALANQSGLRVAHIYDPKEAGEVVTSDRFPHAVLVRPAGSD